MNSEEQLRHAGKNLRALRPLVIFTKCQALSRLAKFAWFSPTESSADGIEHKTACLQTNLPVSFP